MSKAFLIDVSKCIGCRGCQVSCKRWNGLPHEKTIGNPARTNPPRLSAKTWTLVDYRLVDNGSDTIPPKWCFVKRQCMHCEHPACVSACTVGALKKTPEGHVSYDAKKCFGCRYCQYACPFGVPSFQWENPLGLISKCTFCRDRQNAGMEPACCKACPTDAIVSGERDQLLKEAHGRIEAAPAKYVPHVYGEKEVGGTSILYLSPVAFEKLGLPKLDSSPAPYYAEAVMEKTPVVALSVAAVATGLYWIMKRREENLASAQSTEKKEV